MAIRFGLAVTRPEAAKHPPDFPTELRTGVGFMRRILAMTALGACIAIAVVGCCLANLVFPIGGVNVDTEQDRHR